jgi:hypothetical protein
MNVEDQAGGTLGPATVQKRLGREKRLGANPLARNSRAMAHTDTSFSITAIVTGDCFIHFFHFSERVVSGLNPAPR